MLIRLVGRIVGTKTGLDDSFTYIRERIGHKKTPTILPRFLTKLN